MDYWEVVVECRNEITNEPHIHFVTDDQAKFLAFLDTVEVVGGLKCQAYWRPNNIVLCRPCDAARAQWITEYFSDSG